MTTEKLEERHDTISWNNNEDKVAIHTKLSIQFAIEILEDVILNYNKPLVDLKHGLDKIQELKQYLDEQ